MSAFAAPVREPRRTSGAQSAFRDPYAQDTIFAAANQPLLSQLFGSAPRDTRRDQDDGLGSHITAQWRPSRASQPPTSVWPQETTTAPISRAQRAHRVQQWQQDVELPTATRVLDDASRHGVADDPAAVRPARADVNGTGATLLTTEETESEDARLRARQVQDEEAAKVPFYLQVREVKKRVDEQVAVHRGLNNAMVQLQTLQKQVERHRTDTNLGKLLASLRERQDAAWRRAFPDGVPTDLTAGGTTTMSSVRGPPLTSSTPAPTAVTPTSASTALQSVSTPVSAASPTAPNNALKDILETFSRPRGAGGRHTPGAADRGRIPAPPPPPPKKTLPADVVRAPEAPKPYVAYRYVRRPDPPSLEDAYSTDFSVEEGEKASGVISEQWASDSLASDSIGTSSIADMASNAAVDDASFVEDDVVASLPSSSVVESQAASLRTESPSASYETDSFIDEDEDGQDTVASEVGDMSAGASSLRSDRSIRTDSTITDDRDDRSAQRATHDTVRAEAATVSSATLVATLRAFYEACRQANAVAARLTGGGGAGDALLRDGRGRHDGAPSAQRRTSDTESTADSDRAEQDWQALLTKDVTDVHRLRRFVARLQKNLRAVDVQRKVAAARRALLRKAQALSKARARLKRRPDAVLEDVVSSEVESYFGDSWDSFALFSGEGKGNRRRQGPRRGGAGDSIEEEDILSEIASEDFLGSGEHRGGSSDDDGIVDEFDFDMGGSDTDQSVNDEIEDEWDVASSRSGSGGPVSDVEDIVDAVADGAYDDEIFDALGDTAEDGVLDEVESDVASRLAAASDAADLTSLIEDLPEAPSVSSSVLDQVVAAARRRRESDSVVEDAFEQNAAPGSRGDALAELSSLPSLASSADGDVSSLYPDSLASSRTSQRTIDSAEAAYWENVAGEEALLAMEAELRATRHRRARALRTVSSVVPTFSALYNPAADPPPPPAPTEPSPSPSPTASATEEALQQHDVTEEKEQQQQQPASVSTSSLPPPPLNPIETRHTDVSPPDATEPIALVPLFATDEILPSVVMLFAHDEVAPSVVPESVAVTLQPLTALFVQEVAVLPEPVSIPPAVTSEEASTASTASSSEDAESESNNESGASTSFSSFSSID